MAVHVVVDHPTGSWPARVARSLGPAFLKKLGEKRSLTVLLTGDGRIRELNRTFRQIDRTTDVLSFPGDVAGYLGDLAISLDVARRAAKAYHVALKDELALYLAHGILHLLGHDHERSAKDAARMAALEARLLGTAGMLTRAGEGAIPLVRIGTSRREGRKRG